MSRTIKAGDLRHLITLLEPVVSMVNNRRKVTWTEHSDVPAGKRDVSSREFFQAQAYNAEDVITFTIRWRSDVTSSWRVQHGAATYDIIEVNHLGYMRDYMQLKCKEVKGGGA